MSQSVDNGDNVRVLRQTLLLLGGDKRPELVDIDNGTPLHVARQVESAYTNLTEITRVVLIEVSSKLQQRKGKQNFHEYARSQPGKSEI